MSTFQNGTFSTYCMQNPCKSSMLAKNKWWKKQHFLDIEKGQRDNKNQIFRATMHYVYLLGRTNGHLYISCIYKYLQYKIVGGFTPYLPILIDMVQFN